MNLITYISDAFKRGGTPKRYLEWVVLVFLFQVLSSVLPSSKFYESFNSAHIIFGFSILIGGLFLLFRTDKSRIIAAYVLCILGLVLSVATIVSGITSLSGIIFLVAWTITLFVAERREYFSFDLVVLFMVLMLISLVIQLFFKPLIPVADNMYVLITGAIITSVNIYLVYIDFGYEKNFYQESRKTYANLNILSTKLSEILSRKEPLDKLLWYVCRECVPFLEIEECVFYLFDENKNKLIQVAAFGEKSNEQEHRIIDPIEIDPGKGIVGTCFVRGKEIVVEETSKHPEYIVDNLKRNAELSVPIICEGKVVGVFDSEHSVKGFFKTRHVQAFQIIASFCGIKITEERAKTAMLEANEAIEETQRMKELDELKNKFITNISHDLKTPLSLIKSPAIQITKLTDDPKIINQTKYILKNTEHLLRVVNQLLQLNRIDKGLNELYLEDVDLGKLANKIILQYKGLAECDDVNFEFEVDPIHFRTDSFRLEQIIHNLVHNAFRYTGKKGNISLKIKSVNQLLHITVADNGPGIPQALQSKIFERFIKADVNNHEGTGIGLSLVKEYAESLGGKVSLKSVEGEGAEFQVAIPIFEQHESQAGIDESFDDLTSETKPVLLVVEDHPDLNEFIRSSFEHEYHCLSAFDGAEALKLMGKNMVDLIITDLMMPVMDGSEFIKHVRSDENTLHVPIIVLTAKDKIASKVELYELGADNYLTKPFDIEELNAVVKSTLEQRKRLKVRFTAMYLDESQSSGEKNLLGYKNQLVERVIKFVTSNLDDSAMNVGTISTALGIGRNKLQKEIREATSLSPVEFLRSIRLNEARRLLRETPKQVSEVAYMVGFNNLSYFSRAYKQEFAELPSAMR